MKPSLNWSGGLFFKGKETHTMQKLLSLLLVGCLLIPFASGCGENFAAVKGVVKINGEPVEGAEVIFTPKGGGRSAFAETGADGSYELNYTAGNMGAALGEHTVSLSTYQQPTLNDNEKVVDKGVPERFPPDANVRSTLTAEVTSGDNTIDFDIKADKDEYEHEDDDGGGGGAHGGG